MGKQVTLRERKVWDNTLTINLTPLESIFGLGDKEAKDALWKVLAPVRARFENGTLEGAVHDIVWFRQIVLWKTKDGGVKPKDRAPWYQLSKLLNEIGEPDGDVMITLTDYQVKLIGDRLSDGAFEFPAVSAAQDEFVDYLMATLDRKFSIEKYSEAIEPARLEKPI